jgi:lipopolysaccharide assembly outer membrane protein LptD (OstA)
MIKRKKKLKLIQFSLIISGFLIIFLTYLTDNKSSKEEIISKKTQELIKSQSLINKSIDGDVFFNIEYSGFDLSGNRYIIKSKEAFNNKTKSEIVNMKFVEATFYFKDDTILYIWSDKSIYNNKTLDMDFSGNVKGNYEGSKLFAQKAQYSNSKSFLIISENVIINDIKGTVKADQLFFDIKKNQLKIESFNDGKINANIKLNEKKF